MTDPEIIYESARTEQRDAERRAGEELEAALAFARKRYKNALADAVRVRKLRVSQTRNPDCHLCLLDGVPGHWRCVCNYKCPSTLCKGES